MLVWGLSQCVHVWRPEDGFVALSRVWDAETELPSVRLHGDHKNFTH